MSSYRSERPQLSIGSNSSSISSGRSVTRLTRAQRLLRPRNLALFFLTLIIAGVLTYELYSSATSNTLEEWLKRGQRTNPAMLQFNETDDGNGKNHSTAQTESSFEDKIKFVQDLISDLKGNIERTSDADKDKSLAKISEEEKQENRKEEAVEETAETKEEKKSTEKENTISSPIEEPKGTEKQEKGKCAEGCLSHGTCNEELGQCRCPRGFKGPECTELAFPNCHFDPNYGFPSCRIATSCACALDCSKYRFPACEVCFNTSRADGTNEMDLEKIFNSPVVVFSDGIFPDIPPDPGHMELARTFRNPLECSESCSGIGGCYRKEDACE